MVSLTYFMKFFLLEKNWIVLGWIHNTIANPPMSTLVMNDHVIALDCWLLEDVRDTSIVMKDKSFLEHTRPIEGFEKVKH